MTETMGRNRELVLPPGTFAFVLDSTKGKVSVYVGPFKNSLSETDQLVQWDPIQKRYTPVGDIEHAKQVWALAAEGQYVVVTNPAPDGRHPQTGTSNDAVELEVGKRVIVPGPVTFALWPGQSAVTIEGHHLRHNQYVLARVYDEQQARANWQSAVIAPQTGGDDETSIVDNEVPDPSQLTMGQLIIVPGTDVSFYMPSTGIEVVREEGPGTGVSIGAGAYVRDAATLETLEYCVLLDENGQKRYVQGPAVVFPRPTESFRKNGQGGRNFQAIELDERSGLYVKVIEEYTDDNGVHPVGEELFLTGLQQAIYFPRPEHSIITYGDQRKHYAIAIPAGEGRYVLDRRTGQVDLKIGPLMYLPDPRYEVVIRRILDPHDCSLMFPGNKEALGINQRYQDESDEQEWEEETPDIRSLRSMGAVYSNTPTVATYYATSDSALTETAAFGGDSVRRNTTYRPPRTITLDTKYEGAVAINIWTGYAILIADKTGNRRVEVGPKTVLLEYDETIMALELSTGRPKNDDNLLRTGYLRVLNNVVSDLISVETRDLVRVNIGVSYRVNFEGDDPVAWFALENYVQALTDHCRSRLRNIAKQNGIREFYTDTINIVRDALLGANNGDSRPGLTFSENGMRVYDIEVLSVEIPDSAVASLLLGAQTQALSGAVALSIAEDDAVREARLQELRRQTMQDRLQTTQTEAAINLERITLKTTEEQAIEASALAVAEDHSKVVEREIAVAQMEFQQRLAEITANNDADLEKLAGETEQFAKRLEAISPSLIEALTTFGDQALVERITTAMAPAALAAGVSTADILGRVFADTPLAGALDALNARPLAGRRAQIASE